MKKIVLKESEFKKLVENTVRTIINEISSRDQVYLDQINKEFPGEIENWNKRTPIDQFYLDLVNNKKEQDKIQRRTDRKNNTIQRKADYKARYGDRKQQDEAKKREVIDYFVEFLPQTLPSIIDKHMKKTGDFIDTTFYYLMGKFINGYSRLYDPKESDKISSFLEKAIVSGKYEDYFFYKIDEKYGEHVIEW